MCLILFAYDCHPRYRLVVAANRDEFYKRSAEPAKFWTDQPDILAGKDKKEGGTWMGVNIQGHFAGITNYRDPASFKPGAPSRGHLVLDYLLKMEQDPLSFVSELPEGGQVYNGFNLLLGDVKSLYYYSNREKMIRQVDKGVHGLSNSLLDVPWPKVVKGRRALGDILMHDSIEIEAIFETLIDREIPEDQDLPATGVSLEMERWLAPAYVISADYGTRVSTIITADRRNHICFWERSYALQQIDDFNEVFYEFDAKAALTA